MQLWLSTIIQMWAITTLIWLDKEVNCVAVSDHTDLVPFGTWTRFQACWAAPQRPLETSRRAEPDAQAYPAPSLVWRCYSWSSSPRPSESTLHITYKLLLKVTRIYENYYSGLLLFRIAWERATTVQFPLLKKHTAKTSLKLVLADQQAGFIGALATSLAGQDGRPAGTTS